MFSQRVATCQTGDESGSDGDGGGGYTSTNLIHKY